MESQKVKLVVGFITYGKLTSKYLPYFLPSLINQDFKDSAVLCFDNTEEEDDNNENIKFIKENYPEIEIMRAKENIGFARSYNKIINRAKELGAEYFFAINPDMILESDAIQKMVEAMDNNKELGSVSPKVLKWEFENNPARSGAGKKTNVIDTCGIKMSSGLRFIDVRQGKNDNGSFDNINILGPSGAAAIYRISALERVKEGKKYFDELMFMYKEDCDLDYRLFLAGLKSKCVGGAVIYHDRSASANGESNIAIALNRKNKGREVKKWSFWGQQIIFIKFWKLQDWKNKIAIIWYEFKMIVFIIMFEQYLLKELFKLLKLRGRIKIYKNNQF